MLNRILIGLVLLIPIQVASAKKPQIAVSIPPLAEVVTSLIDADVHIILPPGQSAESYDISPKQLIKTLKSELVFLIGVPFEYSWRNKLKETLQPDQIINTQTLVTGDQPTHDHHHEEHHHMIDPHVWLTPDNAIKITETVSKALIENYPSFKQRISDNKKDYTAKLRSLDIATQSDLSTCDTRAFLAYHPAWGHYANRYNLEQFAIEKDGKLPSATHIMSLADDVKSLGITHIIVQTQYPARIASPFATQLSLKTVQVDPLPSAYLENFTLMKKQFAEILRCAK